MRITKAETIRRLRALPLDEPFCKDECPVATLFHVTSTAALHLGRREIDHEFFRWADGGEAAGDLQEAHWRTLTPRQCLEALGETP